MGLKNMVTSPLTPTPLSSSSPTAFGCTSPNFWCQIFVCLAIFPPVHRKKRALCVDPGLKEYVCVWVVSVVDVGCSADRYMEHVQSCYLCIIAVHVSRLSRGKINQVYMDGVMTKGLLCTFVPGKLLGSVVFVQPNFLRMVKLDGKINERKKQENIWTATTRCRHFQTP